MADTAVALFDIPPEGHEPGENERMVSSLLAELDDAGMLTGKYAVRGRALLSVARSVDVGLQASRVSVATTTLVRQLFDGLDQMPDPPRLNSADPYDTLATVIQTLTAQALNGGSPDEPYYD
ncbi:MAG: hypothetical protein PUK40_05430 [Actinomycetaceae bacterium]|nr:hypothetical protein [Arcanobacterium sp.]MDD7505371.1 hypothetical protein [Actinomycetaceae bacterium]MDY6142744.1 hypothetical protein [Arcanobacterium sp.]